MRVRFGALAGAGALALLLLWALPTRAHAQEGRFDVQSFRPSGAPQDLVMVDQTRPMSHLSVAAGIYFNLSLDPLQLVRTGTNTHALSLVHFRLETDVMATMGLFDWLDVNVAVPVVLWQTSDNLEAVGTEGPVTPTALGDVRLSTKIAIPKLKRTPEGKGFGMALKLGLSIPTGNVDAFAGDGSFDYQAGVIADYRFGNGILLAANAGIWIRPDREFAGLKLGDALPLGAAVEVPIWRSKGFTAIAEAYGNISLTKILNQPRQAPVEALVGFRWYGDYGFTWTIGAGGGCTCGFGAPSFRIFTALVWVPNKMKEREAIERFKNPPPPDPDPDHDGLIDGKDHCPDRPGPVENHGCPDEDQDSDGVIDRLDQCPDEAQGEIGKNGCPEAYIKGNYIVIMDQVHFVTDTARVIPSSEPVLAAVEAVLLGHPEISKIEIEGHTDSRAGFNYNIDLSQKRVDAIRGYLVGHGVEPARLTSHGYGETKTVENDLACIGTDAELTPACQRATQANRRVVFHILDWKWSQAGLARAIPTGNHVLESQARLPKMERLPHDGVLPDRGMLAKDGVLGGDSVLQKAGVLKRETVQTKEGVLPSLGRTGGGVKKPVTVGTPKK